MSNDTETFMGIGCLMVIGLLAFALLIAIVFLFYGAIFGAIGAGAYWVFKLLTGLI